MLMLCLKGISQEADNCTQLRKGNNMLHDMKCKKCRAVVCVNFFNRATLYFWSRETKQFSLNLIVSKSSCVYGPKLISYLAQGT